MAVRAGDTTTIIELGVEENGSALDISDATGDSNFLVTPARNGALKTWVAAFSAGGGTDGLVRYTTSGNDIPLAGPAGVWSIQVQVTRPSNGTKTTTPFHFTVEKRNQ